MLTEVVRAGAEVGRGSRDDGSSFTVSGRLFVETSDGRRLHATGGGIGVNANEPMSREEVEHCFSAMVGRDPEHRPFHLAWEQLADVLEREGIAISEEQLNATPFVVEFSAEVLSDLSA